MSIIIKNQSSYSSKESHTSASKSYANSWLLPGLIMLTIVAGGGLMVMGMIYWFQREHTEIQHPKRQVELFSSIELLSDDEYTTESSAVAISSIEPFLSHEYTVVKSPKGVHIDIPLVMPKTHKDIERQEKKKASSKILLDYLEHSIGDKYIKLTFSTKQLALRDHLYIAMKKMLTYQSLGATVYKKKITVHTPT